jgi:hypothetical protein
MLDFNQGPPDPHDPLRPPTWRWERARWLREGRRYARKGREDDFTLVARAYQAASLKANTASRRESLALRYPGLHQAYRLYCHVDHDMRWAVEGYLLGRAGPVEVGNYTGLSPEAVTWYERLFYNVVPRLKHDTYIVTGVMGREVHHGLMERDVPLLWKMIGYGFGHLVLREWVRPVRSHFVRSLDQVAAAESAAYADLLRRKALVSARTVPVYNNQVAIFEAWARTCELARAGGGADVESLLLNNIQASLSALPFVVGRQGPLDLPRLAYYDGQCVELRAHEQMEVAFGRETEAHRQALEWKYPEAAPAAPSPAPAPAP